MAQSMLQCEYSGILDLSHHTVAFSLSTDAANWYWYENPERLEAHGCRNVPSRHGSSFVNAAASTMHRDDATRLTFEEIELLVKEV